MVGGSGSVLNVHGEGAMVGAPVRQDSPSRGTWHTMATGDPMFA